MEMATDMAYTCTMYENNINMNPTSMCAQCNCHSMSMGEWKILRNSDVSECFSLEKDRV